MGFAIARTIARTDLRGERHHQADIQAATRTTDHRPLEIMGHADPVAVEARVRSAISHTPGISLPASAPVLVVISPADEISRGAHLDLPLAVAVLAAAGLIDPASLDGVMFFGELGLDGALRPATNLGTLAAKAAGTETTTIVVPTSQAAEARYSGGGLQVVGADTLGAVIDLLGEDKLPRTA